MRKPKINKNNPGAFYDLATDKTFARLDVVEYIIREDFKFFKKDFARSREDWIADKFSDGEDVDVRVERDITRMNIRNVKMFCDFICKHLKKAEKESKAKEVYALETEKDGRSTK